MSASPSVRVTSPSARSMGASSRHTAHGGAELEKSPLWGDFAWHPCILQATEWMRRQAWRAKPWCAAVVGKHWFQALMFFFTIYALFGDDIRLSCTSMPADTYFDIITGLALALFAFELCISCFGKDDYFLSFFFWLDLIATVSLLLDITVIYEEFVNLTQNSGDSDLARTGRVSRVGTRAGRVIRVIRVIRLIRIIKLYKQFLDMRRRMQRQSDADGTGPGEGIDDEVYAESRVGQKLSHMTTQKVILLILFMLIMLPFISVDGFSEDLPTAAVYGADVVQRALSQCLNTSSAYYGGARQLNVSLACHTFEKQLTMYIGYHHTQKFHGCDNGWSQSFDSTCKLDLGWIGFSVNQAFPGYEHGPVSQHWDKLFTGSFLIPGSLEPELQQKLDMGQSSECPGSSDWRYTSLMTAPDLACPGDLRHSEITTIAPVLIELDADPDIIFVFDLRPWVVKSAVYNILQTIFICIILLIGAMVFSHDANVLVLQPIERMIAKVEKIRQNPLYAMKLGDETYREKQEQEQTPGSASVWKPAEALCACWRRRRDVKVQTLETKILENAIIKLGKLLALGFGEAGSAIIGKNMDDDSATVNAMIPGSKVEAVFGFCDIRNFTDTTEVLQDKVMVFVNQVAEIVHTIVDTWHGAANRNIGDAFLIVWRMHDDFTPEIRTKVGDMSVMSFVQVVAAINKSAVLKDYREHPALLARLPGYRVRMGFGLHYGWAIEGAIGSEFKIDASYLSPHVNMASRLEAVTKQYQVLILMSEPLKRLCSPEMVKYFRTIDHVTLKGGMSTPIRLHTVDLNGDVLKTEHAVQKKGRNQFELRMQRERAKEEKLETDFKVYELFETDPDLRRMRKEIPSKFFQLFSKGYLNYEAGEWDVARAELEVTQEMLSETDGPSKALLDFMAQHDFDSSRANPPKGWQGYRELTEA